MQGGLEVPCMLIFKGDPGCVGTHGMHHTLVPLSILVSRKCNKFCGFIAFL